MHELGHGGLVLLHWNGIIYKVIIGFLKSFDGKSCGIKRMLNSTLAYIVRKHRIISEIGYW
jgi:hypothetical protein